jgi:hypothetical protein
MTIIKSTGIDATWYTSLSVISASIGMIPAMLTVEAEKLTFRGKLSFQRLECTAGLTVATDFVCCVLETILCKQFGKT